MIRFYNTWDGFSVPCRLRCVCRRPVRATVHWPFWPSGVYLLPRLPLRPRAPQEPREALLRGWVTSRHLIISPDVGSRRLKPRARVQLKTTGARRGRAGRINGVWCHMFVSLWPERTHVTLSVTSLTIPARCWTFTSSKGRTYLCVFFVTWHKEDVSCFFHILIIWIHRPGNECIWVVLNIFSSSIYYH